MAGIAGMGTPNALAPTIPGAADSASVQNSINAAMPQMQPQQAPQASAPPSDDDVAAWLGKQQQQSKGVSDDDAAAWLQDYAKQSNMSDADVVSAAKDQGAAPFGERARAGFSGTNADKKEYLENGLGYGKDNVRVIDGDFYVRKAGSPWHAFNSQVTLFNNGTNVIKADPANLVSQGVVEAGALPVEMAGAALGGGAPGIAASRAAGGAIGEVARSAVAAFMGIPNATDPGQFAERVTEQAGLRALVGFGFDKISNAFGASVAKEALNVTADATGSNLKAQAINAAQDYIAQKAGSDDAITATKATLKKALELNAAADRAGVTLRPDELFPYDPKMRTMAESAIYNKSMQDASLARGQHIMDAVDDLSNSFGSGAKSANAAVQIASDMDEFYGKKIGAARADMLANGPKSIPADKLRAVLAETREALGFRVEGAGEKFQGPAYSASSEHPFWGQRNPVIDPSTGAAMSPTEAASGQLPGTHQNYMMGPPPAGAPVDMPLKMRPPDAAALRDLITLNKIDPALTVRLAKRVSTLSDMLESNQEMPTKMVNALYEEFKSMANARGVAPVLSAGEKNSPLFTAAVKLKNAARDTFNDGIQSYATKSGLQEHLDNMAGYSNYKDSLDYLGKLFDSKSPAVSDIVKFVKSGGIDNYGRIDALRGVLQGVDPEAWNGITKAYMDDMLTSFKTASNSAEAASVGNMNWQGLHTKLTKDSRFAEQLVTMIGPDKAQQLMDLSQTGAAIQDAMPSFKNFGDYKKIGAFFKTASRFKFNDAVEVFKSDQYARKLLDPATNANVLRTLTGTEQAFVTKARDQAVKELAAKAAMAATVQQAQKQIQQ